MPYVHTLQAAREFVRAQDGQIAPLSVSEEELNPDVQDDLSLHAYPLEDSERVYPVEYTYPDDAAHSEFSFFEDGRQRTIQIGHIPTEYGSNVLMIPVHYFVVAAVILRRRDRELELWDQPAMRQGILVAKSLVPNQSELDRFVQDGLEIVDTSGNAGGGTTSDYYDMRRRALQNAKSLRLGVEQDLITKWRESADAGENFLVIDGTLMNLRDERNVDRCVGVSKSFGSRYFDVSTNSRVLRLLEQERSWTFQFHDPEDSGDDRRLGARERISWYLRLRQGVGSEPEFGLVRVEISKSYAEQSTYYADRFSKSLISERLPTSYPFPRWDKHLYPIRGCEGYLSSIMPSISTITASMKG